MRVLVSAIIAVLVAGCGSADEPAPEPEHATSSPSDSPPPMPRAAKDDTDSGAIAFTKHYVAVLNYAAVTGDTAELKRLSSPQCEGCQTYIKLFEKTYEANGYFRHSGWEVHPTDTERGDQTIRVLADVDVPPSVYKPSSDDAEEREPAESNELVFKVDFSETLPHMTEFSLSEERSR